MAMQKLDIRGYRDRPVSNTFVRQDGASPHLAVVFPGYEYRATMPALYYPARALFWQGADVLLVEYAYDESAEFRTALQAEKDRWFAADVEAAYRVGRGQRDYQRITLVGKSIGTRAVGHLLDVDERLRDAVCVWLTPLMRDETLQLQIRRFKPRSLFVIGTADRLYDAELLQELKEATGGKSVEIAGADHSLEIDGNVLDTVRAMEEVIRVLHEFLQGEGQK